ncbi:hypothetical protein [Streptomyces sp. NPDC002845]
MSANSAIAARMTLSRLSCALILLLRMTTSLRTVFAEIGSHREAPAPYGGQRPECSW